MSAAAPSSCHCTLDLVLRLAMTRSKGEASKQGGLTYCMTCKKRGQGLVRFTNARNESFFFYPGGSLCNRIILFGRIRLVVILALLPSDGLPLETNFFLSSESLCFGFKPFWILLYADLMLLLHHLPNDGLP